MVWNGRCRKCGSKGPFYKGYRICKKCCGKKTAAWRKKNLERAREVDREQATRRYQRNREIVLEAYGRKCRCCGEDHPAFLALDHKNGGGNKHRRSMSSTGRPLGSASLYAWAIRNKFPKWMQLLCHNCNFAKSHHPGGCPHQKKAA
jgi:hypothetical protein